MENENIRLITACAMADSEELKMLLGERADGRVVAVLYDSWHKVPLHLLTQYARLMWEYWGGGEHQELATRMLEQTAKVEAFWQSYYGWRSMPDIDWQPCRDFVSELVCVDEDILSSAVSKYGHRPMDVELYQAMAEFDFEQVEQLLLQGANPNTYLQSPVNEPPKYYEYNALMEVWSESPDDSFIDEFKNVAKSEDEWDIVTTIFAAAAYANLFILLKRYGYDPAKMSRL